MLACDGGQGCLLAAGTLSLAGSMGMFFNKEFGRPESVMVWSKGLPFSFKPCHRRVFPWFKMFGQTLNCGCSDLPSTALDQDILHAPHNVLQELVLAWGLVCHVQRSSTFQRQSLECWVDFTGNIWQWPDMFDWSDFTSAIGTPCFDDFWKVGTLAKGVHLDAEVQPADQCRTETFGSGSSVRRKRRDCSLERNEGYEPKELSSAPWWVPWGSLAQDVCVKISVCGSLVRISVCRPLHQDLVWPLCMRISCTRSLCQDLCIKVL